MSVDIALIMRKYVHTFSASCLNWALKSFYLFTLLHGILCGFSEFLQLHTSVYLRHSLCLSVILLLYIDSGWFISILHVDIYNCYFSVIVFTWKDFYFHLTHVVYKFWWKFLYRTHLKIFSSKYNDQWFASESCPL